MQDILDSLQRLNSLIKNSPKVQALEHLVDIEVGVVGGALRDTILGKPIKDIDIHVRINLWKNLKVDRGGLNYRDEFVDEKLASREAEAILERSKEILDFMNTDIYREVRAKYPNNNNGVKAVICLVKNLLQQHDYKVDESLDIANTALGIEKIAYMQTGLSDVIKVIDKKSKYPLELLFSQDSINSFTHDFDFNLCKIYMTPDGEITKTKEFLNDVEQKTMTYQPKYSISEKDIQKSLFTRYERLHTKYPEYDLVGKVEHLSKKIKELAQEAIKISKSYHLIKNIPEKKEKINKRYKL